MRYVLLSLILIATGCVAPTGNPAAELDPAGYRVQLRNDDTVTYRNLSVTTGRNVPPLTVAELRPGATTVAAGVAMVHETPLVTVTIGGRYVEARPVDGFEGFNAQLPPGSYVVRLRYLPQYQAMDVRVEALR